METKIGNATIELTRCLWGLSFRVGGGRFDQGRIYERGFGAAREFRVLV